MKFVPNAVSRKVAMTVLKTKKNSPHILFVGGVVGIVGSTFLACRATLKLEPVVDEIREDIQNVKSMKRVTKEDEDQYRRDLVYVYGKSTSRIGRLYGSSVVLGVASIGALTKSHVELSRRNSALSAALIVATEAYENYRDRVREALGEERELDIYHNAHEETIVGEDGKKKKVKVVNEFGWSPYARFFEEGNPNWEKNPDFNRTFVTCQQTWLNQKLQARGFVFLNEAYQALGLEWTKEGQIVGWLRDGDGDNHIDFGLYEAWNERFMQGFERNILLDFNVDGPIYNLI